MLDEVMRLHARHSSVREPVSSNELCKLAVGDNVRSLVCKSRHRIVRARRAQVPSFELEVVASAPDDVRIPAIERGDPRLVIVSMPFFYDFVRVGIAFSSKCTQGAIGQGRNEVCRSLQENVSSVQDTDPSELRTRPSLACWTNQETSTKRRLRQPEPTDGVQALPATYSVSRRFSGDLL